MIHLAVVQGVDIMEISQAVTSSMGVRKNFSRWWHSWHFPDRVQAADNAMQMDVQKTLWLSFPKHK